MTWFPALMEFLALGSGNEEGGAGSPKEGLMEQELRVA